MSLTFKGKYHLLKFQKEYGKKKGLKIFYAFMMKNPDKTKSWKEKNYGI